MMILGSIGTGISIGLIGAAMTWAGGHSPAAMLLAYSVIGSLATLVMGTVMGLRRHEEAPFRR